MNKRDFTIYNGELIGCRNVSGEVRIPDGVTRIGYNVFKGCTGMTSVVLADSIVSIEEGAFKDCTNLSSVFLSKGVRIIRDRAFLGCSSLKSVNIPESVANIGYMAFDECDSLELNEFEGVGYLGNANNPFFALIRVLDRDAKAIKIHSDTKVIGGDAFAKCKNLSSISIPNKVKSIGSGAFFGCARLSSTVHLRVARDYRRLIFLTV